MQKQPLKNSYPKDCFFLGEKKKPLNNKTNKTPAYYSLSGKKYKHQFSQV